MKHPAWLMLLPVSAALVLGYLTDFSGKDHRALAAPPLSLEGYLDEKLPEASEDDAPEMKADNFACFVCHGNYEEEELVVSHGVEGVGCVDCHGASFEHRDDEDNVTPPDKMYALEDVDKMCGACHDMHDAPARKVIERWQQRCPAKTSPEEIVCTDCHYRHRLKFRTVWWDKKTRRLIVRDKGQRTKTADDLTKTGGPADGEQ